MTSLSFSLSGTSYVSDAFTGSVAIQLLNTTGKTVRVGIETCIDSSMGWCNLRSVMLNNPTQVFTITGHATDQQFRLTSQTEIQASYSEIKSISDITLANLEAAAGVNLLATSKE